jgi:hypothetical protein
LQPAIAAPFAALFRREPTLPRRRARAALFRILRWWVAVLSLAAVLFPRSALAQQGAGVLVGNVVDASSKEPVADAVVTVTSPGLQGEQMVVTDATGLYRIPALPPGTYVVRIEKEQFKPFAGDGISLRADTTIRLNAELLPESLKARVEERALLRHRGANGRPDDRRSGLHEEWMRHRIQGDRALSIDGVRRGRR